MRQKSPFYISLHDLWFPLLVVLLVGIRFLHFGEFVDEPHSWRQCDTANYIWSFYQDGIDLSHPSVCWMGGHKTTILEFPLPEAVVAIFYKIFGPHLIIARGIFLLIFLGGVFYFYKIVRLFAGHELAKWSTLLYLAFPLGIYYSRAIHVDFSAIFLGHYMLYQFMKGVEESTWWKILLGGLLGGIGFMIKAPYLFYLALPLLAWVHHLKKWKFLFRHFYLFLLPIAIFIPWQMHVHAVNNAAPDWDYIPHYKKFVNMWGWYFGTWEMRQIPNLWLNIYGHIHYEILAYWGLPPVLLGFMLRPLSFRYNFIRLWLLGTLIYVFIFFNLNFVHNYYQLPLIAPLALGLGVVLMEFRKLLGTFLPRISYWIVVIPMAVFSFRCYQLTEKVNPRPAEEFYFSHYFRVPPVPIETGSVIRQHTQPKDLIIVSYGGFDCRTPLILYRARRNGWQIPQAELTPAMVEALRKEGATHFAAIPLGPLPSEMLPYLSQFELRTFPLPELNLNVEIYDLD